MRTAAFAVLFYGFTVLILVATVLVMPFSHRALLALPGTWSRWHRFCVRHVLGIEVLIEGERPEGQAIYAMRHESYFEAIDIPTFIGGAPIPFAKEELSRIPLWGIAADRYGLISVERTRGPDALRAMAKAARALKPSGRSFAIFPEGTRVPQGETRPLGAGTYAIYKLLGLPLAAVAVRSRHVYAQKPKRSGTIRYRVVEVIEPGLDRDTFESRVFAAINALNPPRQDRIGDQPGS